MNPDEPKLLAAKLKKIVKELKITSRKEEYKHDTSRNGTSGPKQCIPK